MNSYLARLAKFASLLPILVCTSWAQQNYSGPLELGLRTGVQELFPGGPKAIWRHSTVEVPFGPDRSHGYLLGYYNAAGELIRTETYNSGNALITTTDYHSRGPGIVETAYDLEETGQPSRWERSEPSSEKPGNVAYITEELDAASGARVVLLRVEVAAAQPCDAKYADLIDPAVVKAVDRITGPGKEASCPVAGDSSGIAFTRTGAGKDEEELKIKFAAAGAVCLDKNCDVEPNRFETLFDETIKQGVKCMAQLGTRGMSKSDAKKAAKELINAGKGKANAKFLKKHFALKNAAQLLLLVGHNISPFKKTFNIKQQSLDTGMQITDSGKTVDTTDWAGSAKGANKAIGHSGVTPFKFTCQGVTGFHVNQTAAGSTLTNDMSFRKTSVEGKSALPGGAGWPHINLAPSLFKKHDDAYIKATIFHEMLHSLGYPHWEAGMQSGPPVATACQACCFPMYLKKSGDDSCTSGAHHKAICDTCAGVDNGDYATRKKQIDKCMKTDSKGNECEGPGDEPAGLRSYDEAMSACYSNGNIW